MLWQVTWMEKSEASAAGIVSSLLVDVFFVW
jgi:hypothetical protein